MLQRRDRMMAIPFGHPEISIVQQDNIPSSRAPQVLDHLFRRAWLPIPCQSRPHHDAGSAPSAHRAIQQRPAETERRPHPPWFSAGRFPDRIVAAVELGANFCRRAKHQAAMRIRVIADRMAALGDFPRQVRKRADVLARQEKCRANVVPRQQIEQRWRDGGIRPVVKRERHCGGIVGSPDRGAEDLRRRRHGRPRKTSARGARATRFDQDWNRMHAWILALPRQKFHAGGFRLRRLIRWRRNCCAPTCLR